MKEVPQGDLKVAIQLDIKPMHRWYEAIGEEYPEDIDYQLLEYLEQVKDLTRWWEDGPLDTIDNLVRLYIGWYCDAGPGKISHIPDTAMLKVDNYHQELERIEARCTLEVQALWRSLLDGRSIVSGQPLPTTWEGFLYCSFTKEECMTLERGLVKAYDSRTSLEFSGTPAIGSILHALRVRKGPGLLICVS